MKPLIWQIRSYADGVPAPRFPFLMATAVDVEAPSTETIARLMLAAVAEALFGWLP